jgi:hypothetical protein
MEALEAVFAPPEQKVVSSNLTGRTNLPFFSTKALKPTGCPIKPGGSAKWSTTSPNDEYSTSHRNLGIVAASTGSVNLPRGAFAAGRIQHLKTHRLRLAKVLDAWSQ